MIVRNLMATAVCLCTGAVTAEWTYPIVDTGQVQAFGERFPGQDAHYAGRKPAYLDHGNGTVSDLVTGLMWQQDPGEKMTFAEAVAGSGVCRTGGYTDWRLPSIKELYSLIQFNGMDPDPTRHGDTGLTPFIDASVFAFQYGSAEAGERVIDAQYASSTRYLGTTMGGNQTVFGVNFADGRIKGYPIENPRGGNKRYAVLYVRGNRDYGTNRFRDNTDGTVSDDATGLTWMKADSGTGMDWPAALNYAEQLELAGYDDWRLPSAKELQSIVDYQRSPDTTGSAAIDPIFAATAIGNEEGKVDFGQYWTSTTHVRGNGSGETAAYIAFGRGLGWMQDRRSGEYRLMDVHGAGCQRSDPKVGDATSFPRGRGPQGDVIRIDNLVRCVRGGNVKRVEADVALQAPPVAPASHDFVGRLDRDGDGKVSRDEFDGPRQHFVHLDRDGDGSISETEAPQGPPPGERTQRR